MLHIFSKLFNTSINQRTSETMTTRNPLDAMCLFPELFASYIETNNTKLELSTINRYYAKIFGINLNEHIYDILKEIEKQNWLIKIRLNRRQVTHLYMRKKDNTTGDIPECVCQLKTLKVLVIRCEFGATITGGIPEKIGELANLETFDAKNIGITNGFPESMVQLTKLQSLDLTGNKIIEDIPFTWFGETGPLRAKDSKINIWRRVRNGWPYYYRGSILEMSENERKTPYILVGENEWITKPILCRSMAIKCIKTWYGTDYVE